MNKNIFLFFLFLIIGVSSFKYTYAAFISQNINFSNTFQAASVFPTPTASSTPSPTPTQNSLMINEVSPEGSSPGEWIEIFNPQGSAVDITGWKISDGTGEDVFPSALPIPVNGYAVIVASGSTVVVPPTAVKIQLSSAIGSSGLSDPGEPVILKDSADNIIDQMSYGNNISVFASPPGVPAAGFSVGRIPNGTDTNSSSDWQTNLTPSLGVSN